MDRRFSYSKIDAALQRNKNEERMGLMPKDYGMETQNAPSDTTKGELFSGSLGLLNGNASSYNAADVEANQEMAEILRKRKKRKRGMIATISSLSMAMSLNLMLLISKVSLVGASNGTPSLCKATTIALNARNKTHNKCRLKRLWPH